MVGKARGEACVYKRNEALLAIGEETTSDGCDRTKSDNVSYFEKPM